VSEDPRSDLVQQLYALRQRVEFLERQIAGGSSETNWQRQAIAYRSALLRLSEIGHDYDAAVTRYDTAADKLNEAQAALLEGRKAQNQTTRRYRDTISALISPNDPDDLNSWATTD
jgi:hypothetical protein